MKYLVFALSLLLALPVVIADEAQFVITNPWLITSFRPGYEATTAAWVLAGIGTALILAFAFRNWSKRTAKQRKPLFWLKAAGGIAVVLIAAYILYSTYDYMYSGVAKTGLVTCDTSGCTISMHWHATIEGFSVCGAPVERPWEAGDLGKAHTHKDDRIHMHTLLPVDPTTKELLDTTPMTLGAFFDNIGWKLSENCFKDTCDACNGQPASTKAWINGQPVGHDALWKDGDVVRVAFE